MHQSYYGLCQSCFVAGMTNIPLTSSCTISCIPVTVEKIVFVEAELAREDRDSRSVKKRSSQATQSQRKAAKNSRAANPLFQEPVSSFDYHTSS